MPNQVIPIIDIAPLKRRNGQRKDTIDQIREACRDWGFFHITGHDLSADLISRVWWETKRFFAFPFQTKKTVERSKDHARGWFNRELTKNIRDMKEVFDFGGIPHPELLDNDPANWTRDGWNQWPKPSLCPAFKATMWEYFTACERVAFTLLEAVGESLSVPGDCITRDFQNNHTSF
ncbi:MAG: 2-oxoglutarate and iron-dependent oxygenase domain-containing protein, partial [Nitrospirota bacterium]|nr:2-oxoglutarate and iron-dependent oxygenase domain-containing protein [Nitrospirota bacterium]